MSSFEQPLVGPIHFQKLSEEIFQRGIKNLVETGTGPSSSGMEAAHRLGLKGFSCDVFQPCVDRARELYPGFKIEHANSIVFLNSILPTLNDPTFFWLDGHCPTDEKCLPGGLFPLYEEMQLLKSLKKGWQHDVIWLDDIPMIMDPANPIAWKVAEGVLAGRVWRGERDHSWAEYCAVFSETHDSELVDSVLRLTPKINA